MAVDLFQSIDRAKIDLLPFVKGVFPFGYIDTNSQSRIGIVYEIDATDCKKMRSLFKGKEEKIISKKDRVFVLSGCKVPQFKIKEYCRGVGAIMTNDIEDATVFVGNDRIYQDSDTYAMPYINSLSMILDTTWMKASGDEVTLNHVQDDVLEQYYPDGNVKSARYSKFMASRYSEPCTGSVRQMYCMTPYAAKVVYEILSRNVTTINEECLMKQLPPAAILDKTLCDQVLKMMDSGDDENHKVAHEILANSDYSDSLLYLYRIAHERYSQISNSRYKNVRLFVEESELARLYSLDEEDFLKDLMLKDKLTKEAVEELMPIIAKDIETVLKQNKSSVFNIKLELRPDLAAILGDHSYNTELGLKPLNEKPDEDN